MFRNVPKGGNNSRGSGGAGGSLSNFRGRGRGRGGGQHQQRQDPTKSGLFSDGIWLCNCTPRLPAEHFKVKKEGRNQGRWFYTCQNSEGRRCGFFLWGEDAKPREEAAVLSGTRNEPRATPSVYLAQNADGRDGSHASVVEETQFPGRMHLSQMSTQTQDAPPPYTLCSTTASSVTLGRDIGSGGSGSNSSGYASNVNDRNKTTQNATPSKKRTLNNTRFDFENDDDDDADSFAWELTGKEADELEQRAVSQAPETPRKAAKTDVYATPNTTGNKRQLPWLNYTEEDTAPSKLSFQTPSRTDYLLAADSLPTPSHTRPVNTTTENTPTPSRFRDALAESCNPSALVNEVFSLLDSTKLASNVAAKLRSVLSNHDLKTQGVVKGRDLVRLALKARDAKVVELNARIAALEAESELDKARIRGLRLKDVGVL